MFEGFQELKKHNKSEIVNILLDSNLSLAEKELKLEDTLTFNILKLYDDNQIYVEELKVLRKQLYAIDWSKIEGKTILAKFFEKIHKETLIDLILIKVLLKLKYINCYSADYLRNLIIYDFKHYAFYNYIQIRYKCTDPAKFRPDFIEYELVEKACSYVVECLKEYKIVKYDFDKKTFQLEGFVNICVQETFFLTIQKWPLLIPAKKYEYINDAYEGGYYLKENKLNLLIENLKIESNIEINEKCLENIHKLQSTKYTLLTNPKIIEAIEFIEEFLTPQFLNLAQNAKYMEDWYACYQYLILVKSNITNIYFPFVLDFRGRIYNGISFGLNPTTNKLSRVLVGFGKAYLNETSKLYLQCYICACFKISLENFDSLLDINLDFTNSQNIQELIFKYSFKNLIILLDWKENVIKNGYTEIGVELDASQSGFQVLSLLSNDYQGMIHTNMIKTNESYDLYRIILTKLQEKINNINPNWNKIINREFIKRVIMTIPYGSTTKGQIEMLVDEFIKQYSLRYLLEVNSIPAIVESNILDNEILVDALKVLNEKIYSDNYKTIKIDTIEKYQTDMIENLKKNAFKEILRLLNEITVELYPNIITFTKNLKKLKLKHIVTPYYLFSLVYFRIYIEEMTIRKKIYTKMIIDSSKIDKRKTTIASIANICQGMGDAFVMHNIIENIIVPIYPIHDAILCNVNTIEIIQKCVLNSYQFVYDYYFVYEDFQKLEINRNERYKLNSLDIFKIK
jgi:hypothetical protein